MKKYEMINPQNVLFVSLLEEENREDEYIWICKLTTKESVLLKYNPLITIKQFIGYKFAVTKNREDDKLVKIEQVMVYIDYYGFERTEIKDELSSNEIVKVFDSYVQADRYILNSELEKITTI